jgi:hypothetical protein
MTIRRIDVNKIPPPAVCNLRRFSPKYLSRIIGVS